MSRLDYADPYRKVLADLIDTVNITGTTVQSWSVLG